MQQQVGRLGQRPRRVGRGPPQQALQRGHALRDGGGRLCCQTGAALQALEPAGGVERAGQREQRVDGGLWVVVVAGS